MSLPPPLQAVLGDFGLELILVLLMGVVSLLLVALAFERLVLLFRVRVSIASAHKLLAVARAGTIEDAAQAQALVKGPARLVFVAGLDRATGKVRGSPARAMAREGKRVAGAMKARTWLLGTAGALMPFVGLFGTVIGVMSAFQAIGETGQGGFAIVSVGISQALVATAVGIAVALEGVVLFNLLQNMAQRLSRELAMLADELLELIEFEARDQVGLSRAPMGGAHAGRPQQ